MIVVGDHFKHLLFTVLYWYLVFPFVPFFSGTVKFLKEILGGPRTFQGSPNVLKIVFGQTFHLHRCHNYNFSLSYTDGERVQILLCLLRTGIGGNQTDV